MERVRKAGLRDVRESHGYAIQHLIGAERSITELAERMGVTRQAGSKVAAELVGPGVLQVTAGEDRRARRIGLSPDGYNLVKKSRRARMQVHARLVKKLGESKYDSARKIVLECLEIFGGVEAIKDRRIRAPR
jgi:DNA-binding MarR family transcriptional regulator